jgi:PKD repeat protein
MSAPTSWFWDFGDGNTSTDQNPTHIYTAPGLYTVSLTVSNEYGTDTETKIYYINVTMPVPVYEIRWFDPPTETTNPVTPSNPIYVEVTF